MADRLRDRIQSGVVVLGTALGERAVLLAAVTKDLTGRYHAGNIIKQLAPLVGGGGGGRPDFAQAGGKDPDRLDAALAAAYDLLGRGKRSGALSEPAVAPVPMRFGNQALFRELLGQHDEHVKLLERELGVRIEVGDGTLTIHGDAVEAELASRSLTQLYGLLEQGYPIFAADVEYALRILVGRPLGAAEATSSSTRSSSPPTSASSRRRASTRRRTSTRSGTTTSSSGSARREPARPIWRWRWRSPS